MLIGLSYQIEDLVCSRVGRYCNRLGLFRTQSEGNITKRLGILSKNGAYKQHRQWNQLVLSM